MSLPSSIADTSAYLEQNKKRPLLTSIRSYLYSVRVAVFGPKELKIRKK
jgi:hypothetical protein